MSESSSESEDEFDLNPLIQSFKLIKKEFDTFINESKSLGKKISQIEADLEKPLPPTVAQLLDSYIETWKQESRFTNNGLEVFLNEQECKEFNIPFTNTSTPTSIYLIASIITKKIKS